VNRREFAESAALAALAPLLGVAPTRLRLETALGGSPLAGAAPAEIDEPGALARALAEAIRVQYGSRLQAGDLATITQQIQASLERAEQVRKMDLANGDEPNFVFSAAPSPPAT
jgi:hypothetical protein